MLSHVLNNSQGKKVAVIVNDMSEINIDSATIQNEVSLRRSDERLERERLSATSNNLYHQFWNAIPMENAKTQQLLDRTAISASALCMLHCLLTPVLLIVAPVVSSTLLADEAFHKALVMFVIPVSVIALFMGCRHHKDRTVGILGAIGLISLVLIAFFGHDLLGEIGEKAATVISGAILAYGHFRNYKLCRDNKCGS